MLTLLKSSNLHQSGANLLAPEVSKFYESALVEVLTDLQLRWNIKEEITTDHQLNWNILNAVTTDNQLSWNILNEVVTDLLLQWNILSTTQVTTDLQIHWSIIESVNSDLQLRWNIQTDDVFPDIDGKVTFNSQTGVITIKSI